MPLFTHVKSGEYLVVKLQISDNLFTPLSQCFVSQMQRKLSF